MEKKVVRISVRNLVEFILRSGDLDSGSGVQDKEAMQKGSRIHRKIQKQMGSSYRPEVSLKQDTEYEDLILRVEGRADGIFTEEETVCIDEIKGVYKKLEHLESPVEVHRAQAMCYAWIYMLQNDLEKIDVQMTYAHLDTEEIRRFREFFSREELEAWYQKLTGEYHKWVSFRLKWQEKRNASMKNLEFPFPYRKGQREMVAGVYHAVSSKKQIFVQAPTGVGKTMSSVFPSVRAIGEGKGELLFYLTAKTITRTVAQDAFEILRTKGLLFQTVTITAKEKLCFCEKTECTPEKCPWAKGHFDRVNDAVYELWTAEQSFSREKILEQAEKWKVCPFEMCLDLSSWVDGVICDYNYVFDPNAHLRRFFGEGMNGEYLFLIDEAHNLVERGRSMYSAKLCKEDFLKVKRLVKDEDAKLAKRISECNQQLLALKRECEDYQVLNSVSHIYLKLLNVMGELERFLEDCKKEELRKEVLEFYFDIRRFISTHDRLDENYVIYSELLQNGYFEVHLFCVNPAGNLQEFLDKGNSTVFFSATLLPVHYYKRLLSTEKDNYAVYAESPFDQEKRLLLLGTDVSTKYTRRGEDTYRRYAQYLYQTALAKRGNYIAFFPSYRFMEDVHEEFLAIVSEGSENVEDVMQSPYMSEEAREIFLENFEEDRANSFMGFCVMGGIFSEGIDLTGEQLIGAVIVGTGLPQVCREREILKQHFDEQGFRGFDYAYLYPGMNKVLQSAGRVIRTQEDRGVVLLLDDRFLDAGYREVFPREWGNYKLCRQENAAGFMKEFWSRKT